MYRIFISYSRVDEHIAKPLKEALERRGFPGLPRYDVWFDQNMNLQAGVDWKQEILWRIERCDIFLYLISRESNDSEVCKWELQQAIDQKKHIIPIRVRSGASLPHNLNHLQCIDVLNSLDISGFNAIQDSINNLDIFNPNRVAEVDWRTNTRILEYVENLYATGFQYFKNILSAVEDVIAREGEKHDNFPFDDFTGHLSSHSQLGPARVMQTWTSLLEDHKLEAIKGCLHSSQNLRIEFLLVNPNSEIAKTRSLLLGKDQNFVGNQVYGNLRTIRKLQAEFGEDRISMKWHDGLFPFALHMCNGNVYIGLFRQGDRAVNGKNYRFAVMDRIGRQADDEFNKLWEKAYYPPVNII